MCLMSVMTPPRWNFRVLSTALITAPSFDETARIYAVVAVVDTHSLAGRRAKPLRGECSPWCAVWDNTDLAIEIHVAWYFMYLQQFSKDEK
jgi:hypothetical protein